MGTRGAYGYLVDGQEKVAYNHFDSYPSGLGTEVLNYIRNHTVEEMREVAKRITFITDEVPPTKEQIKRFKKFADLEVSSKDLSEWYCLLRESQGNLESFHEGLDVMKDSKDFLADSLFCEYAYIINLDTNELEVYKGFNQNKNAQGRYAHLQDGDYHGVKLVSIVGLEEVRAMTDEHLSNYIGALENIESE